MAPEPRELAASPATPDVRAAFPRELAVGVALQPARRWTDAWQPVRRVAALLILAPFCALPWIRPALSSPPSRLGT